MYIFLAAGLLFFILGLVISLPDFHSNAVRRRIAEEGKSGEGFNLELHDGGLTVNDVSYFYLTFDYYDGDELKSGKTSTAYTAVEASNIVARGSLDIRYDDRGAVQADFDRGAANRRTGIFFAVFCGLGLIFIVVGGMSVIRGHKRSASVYSHGTEATGLIVGLGNCVSVNGSKLYSVKVSYTNMRGEYTEGETDTIYPPEEAHSFAEGSEVRIKYYGKSVAILPTETTQADGESI